MAEAQAPEETKTDWSPAGGSTLDALMRIVESDDYRETVGTPWKDGHELLYQGVGGVHVLGSRHVSVAADRHTTHVGADRSVTVHGNLDAYVGSKWVLTRVPDDVEVDTAPSGKETLHVKGNMNWDFHERMVIGTGSIERTWYGGIAKIAGLEGVICGGVWNRLYAGPTMTLAGISSIDVYGGSLRAAAARNAVGAFGYRSCDNATWRVGVFVRATNSTIEPLVASDSALEQGQSRLKTLGLKLAMIIAMPLFLLWSVLTAIPFALIALISWMDRKWFAGGKAAPKPMVPRMRTRSVNGTAVEVRQGVVIK